MFSNFVCVAAFIDDVMNSLHSNMLFFLKKKNTENVYFIEVLPSFFCTY